MEAELADLRADGYVSDTPFHPSVEGASEDVSNLVWVGNLPIVPEDKVGKLTNYARTKIFEKVRALVGSGAWRARAPFAKRSAARAADCVQALISP